MDSFNHARMMCRQEGIFCGGSTGTIVSAALQLARGLDENALIVFIICDTGERYLSKFHSDEWLKEKRLLPREIKSLNDISIAKRQNGSKELVYINAKDKIKKAFDVINKNGFSQIPVINDGKSVGSIREGRLMAKLIEDPDLMESNVENIMDESFPVIDEETDLISAKKYLSKSPAVLVSEYGRIIDIITRYDILEHSDIS